MTETHHVACSCGFLNVVPDTAFGSSVECFNCGAVLEVNKDTVGRGDHDNASGRPETAPVPAGPSTARSPFEDDSIDSADRPFSPEQGVRPSSPFEEEEEDTPEPNSIEAAPSGQQRVRSAFEDEAEEAELPESDAFSREAAEAQQPASTGHALDALRPKKPSTYVHIENQSGLDRKTGELCTRCGREIRGDWDRLETPDGIICYICSNQGTHGMPERFHTAHERRELSADDFLIDKRPAPPPPPTPWYRDPESPGFRRTILSIAFGTVLLALVVHYSDWGTPSEETLRASRTAAVAAEEIELPLLAKVVIWSWRVFAVYLGYFLTIYLVLGRDNRLPYDSLKGNAVYIGLVLLLITGIQGVTWLLYLGLREIFVVGVIWGMLLAAVSGLVQIKTVITMLDYRLSDWAWSFFYFFLTQTIVQGIGLVLYWGIYQLVT